MQTANGRTYHQRTLSRSGPALVVAGSLQDRRTTLTIPKHPANVDGQEHRAEAAHRWRHYHLRPGYAVEQPIHAKRRYVETLILMQVQTGPN